jgi:hypothetical protein
MGDLSTTGAANTLCSHVALTTGVFLTYALRLRGDDALWSTWNAARQVAILQSLVAAQVPDDDVRQAHCYAA